MIFLFSPTHPVRWNSFPDDLVEQLGEHNVDVERLEWLQVDDLPLTAETQGLALRLGTPVSGGILVRGMDLSAQYREATLLKSLKQRPEFKKQNAANDAFMEQMMPGWTSHTDELDEKIALNTRAELGKIQAKRDEILSRPVPPENATHWMQLGGMI